MSGRSTPSPDGRYLVSGSVDQTMRLWNLATRQLIVSLFHGNDGEWVMWTPQGYYTGSTTPATSSAGSRTSAPTRPPLRHGGISSATSCAGPTSSSAPSCSPTAQAAVNELAGKGPTLAALVGRPPPEVHAGGDYTTNTGRATLVLEVERTGRAVEAFAIQLGDYDTTNRFAVERTLPGRPAAVPAGYKRIHPDRELRAFEVDLTAGTNVLRVVARTDAGETFSNPTQIVSREFALADRAGTLRILAIGIDRYPQAQLSRQPDLRRQGRARLRRHRRQVLGPPLRARRKSNCWSTAPATAPTKANIEAALQRLKQAGPQDQILLFIAGHGESRARPVCRAADRLPPPRRQRPRREHRRLGHDPLSTRRRARPQARVPRHLLRRQRLQRRPVGRRASSSRSPPSPPRSQAPSPRRTARSTRACSRTPCAAGSKATPCKTT